jgi:hypothetical protein
MIEGGTDQVPLTEKTLLEYINRFVARYGAEPSYATRCKYFRLESKTKVVRCIASLEKRGLLKKRDVTSPLARPM